MAAINLTASNLLNSSEGAYASYANKVVAFVFIGFTGLQRINGELLVNIAIVPNLGANPKLGTVSTYGVGAEWAIPANNLGKYTDAGNTYYVVFGYVDPAGTRMATAGTCGTNVVIEMDDTYLTNTFKLTGSKLVGLPSRSDCAVVATNFQISGNAAGDLPINATS